MDIWFDVDAALAEVPVNIIPLVSSTDYITINETLTGTTDCGIDLNWNFVNTAGAMSQTFVQPTTDGNYLWTHLGNGMYTIYIPASGGASINNDAEGFGWFTGVATDVLPWRSPVFGFRASGLNDKLIDSAYSATRGLSGTALPDAAADAAGGLPISDLGELDLDTQIGTNIDAILLDTGTDGVVLKAAGLADDAVNEIVDQVWNEAIADHTTATTFGGKNQKVVPSETINDYKANVSALTNVTLAATQTGVTIPTVTAVTNGVTLANDAITSEKFDESTAFPVKKADALTTELARKDSASSYMADVSGLATPTNITGGTITTVTNLTNAPTNGDLTATMKTSVTTAASSATPALSATGVDAILDEVVVGTYTMRQLLTVMSSALAGKLTGGGTTTLTFRGINDASNVIVATVDASGNRSALTITV